MRRLLAVVALAVGLGVQPSAASPPQDVLDPLAPAEWWLHAVGADRSQPPGPGVPLTIVDSGVDATHPEFADRPGTTYLNAQTVSGGSESHGTKVASIAAAPANGVGLVGIYPQAALQIFDASPGEGTVSYAAASDGIRAAAAHCPGVVNLSFGGPRPDPQLHAAIVTAVHDGCLVVAAAGNDGAAGSPTIYPAAWPHVLTVAATDESDRVTQFSTAGQDVDLAAPGVDLTAAVPLSGDPSGYEGGLDGTSFAAPIVAAAAAWVWTLRPTLSPSQLAELLRRSARDVGPHGFDRESGWGILDIPAALAAPAPQADPLEPNDDVDQVKPGRLFPAGEPPLTTAARPSQRIAGTLDVTEDPRDVYRIRVPAHRVVRVGVAPAARVSAQIWGPRTTSVEEGAQGRRRHLYGTEIRGGRTGFTAYVEVLLTGRSGNAAYVLAVKAAPR